MYKQLLMAITLSALVACAAPTERSDQGLADDRSSGSDCISEGSIRDYTVLDDANLIISAGASRKYHMVLSRRAFGLRSTWRIAFSSPTGRVCAGFGEIIVDEGFAPEKIRIATIRKLTPEETDDLLIRFGKKEPEIEQPRQPQDVEGAKVEELD